MEKKCDYLKNAKINGVLWNSQGPNLFQVEKLQKIGNVQFVIVAKVWNFYWPKGFWIRIRQFAIVTVAEFHRQFRKYSQLQWHRNFNNR